jgi:excinuclease UvrABC nuclease subunit
MQEIYKANIDELSKVPGISKKLAQDIYDFLHS